MKLLIIMFITLTITSCTSLPKFDNEELKRMYCVDKYLNDVTMNKLMIGCGFILTTKDN